LLGGAVSRSVTGLESVERTNDQKDDPNSNQWRIEKCAIFRFGNNMKD